MGARENDLSTTDQIGTRIGRLVDATADEVLLARFAAHADGSAFELLVWRHARAVHRTCRDLLGDHHAAEDAAQAVFLILARRADGIRDPRALAAWLHRTAVRVARRAARVLRRRAVTAQRLDALPKAPATNGTCGDAAVLHEELDRLPREYRTALVLCFFEGLTHAAAAARLGWPVGTVDGRIARAKKLLAARLERRGVSAAVLTVAGSVSVPAAGARAAAVPSVFAHQLAREVLQMTRLAKILWLTGSIALTACLAVAASTGGPVPPAADAPVRAAPVPLVKPRGIDAEVIAAFEKTGAVYGGFVCFDDPSETGTIVRGVCHGDLIFRAGAEAARAGVPGFSWDPDGRPTAEQLRQLPRIDVPFGLELILSRHFADGARTEAALKELARFPNLAALVLDTPVAVGTLAPALTELRNLKALSLCTLMLSDAGAAELAKLTALGKLTTFALRTSGVTDAGAKELAKLTRLTTLKLVAENMTDAGVKDLGRLENLTTLMLSASPSMSPGVTGAGLVELSRLTKLTTLYLQETEVDHAAIKGIAKLSELRRLKMPYVEVVDADVKELAKLSNLTTLRLEGFMLTDAAAADIAKLTKLTKLRLKAMITDAGAKELAKLSRLTTLELKTARLTEAGAKELAKLKHLQNLQLPSPQLMNAWKEAKR